MNKLINEAVRNGSEKSMKIKSSFSNIIAFFRPKNEAFYIFTFSALMIIICLTICFLSLIPHVIFIQEGQERLTEKSEHKVSYIQYRILNLMVARLNQALLVCLLIVLKYLTEFTFNSFKGDFCFSSSFFLTAFHRRFQNVATIFSTQLTYLFWPVSTMMTEC
jgi:hypothetical protein